MKKFILAAPLLFIFTLIGCASTYPVKQEDRTFENIVEVNGFTKDQIYVASKVWLAQTFASAKAVTEMDSQEAGILIGNGNTTYPCEGIQCIATVDWRVKFTMRIDMKDDKFKIAFSNINLAWPSSYANGVNMPSHDAPVSTQGDMDRIKPKLLALGDELKTAILQNKTNSNW